tara:strand:+ start:400 stop:648 length:249 start_codon:yes stop_codon:yes gene_type:complete
MVVRREAFAFSASSIFLAVNRASDSLDVDDSGDVSEALDDSGDDSGDVSDALDDSGDVSGGVGIDVEDGSGVCGLLGGDAGL